MQLEWLLLKHSLCTQKPLRMFYHWSTFTPSGADLSSFNKTSDYEGKRKNM